MRKNILLMLVSLGLAFSSSFAFSAERPSQEIGEDRQDINNDRQTEDHKDPERNIWLDADKDSGG